VGYTRAATVRARIAAKMSWVMAARV